MEAFKRSISVETTTKSKKPRKAAAGQKEMLLPIGGKKGRQGECKENRQATTAVGMTTTTHDIYNNPPWTDMDIDDLKAAIENGRSVQDAAEFHRRSDSIDDVRQKCEELGLKVRVGNRASPQGF